MELFEKFYNKTLRFLSFRPRSEKEVRDYLLRHSGKRAKRAHPESKEILKQVQDDNDDSGQARMTIIKQVIAKLKQQNFINDEEFTKWWIEQRTQSRKPKGIRLIKLELQQKGIDRETIDKILGDYDIKILSEEAVKKLIAKVLPRYRNLPRQKAYQKLSQFLLRRGFDWETVKKAVDPVKSTV